MKRIIRVYYWVRHRIEYRRFYRFAKEDIRLVKAQKHPFYRLQGETAEDVERKRKVLLSTCLSIAHRSRYYRYLSNNYGRD